MPPLIREYDSGGIEQKEISEDVSDIFSIDIINVWLPILIQVFVLQVVVHMSERMTRLPHGMQLGLKLSACLGSKFDVYTLEKGIPGNDLDINEVRLPGLFYNLHCRI